MQYDVFKFTGKKPVSVKNICYIHIKNLKKKTSQPWSAA